MRHSKTFARIAAVAITGSIACAAPASAETVRYLDDMGGSKAPVVDVSNVKVSNGKKRVVVTVTVPNLRKKQLMAVVGIAPKGTSRKTLVLASTAHPLVGPEGRRSMFLATKGAPRKYLKADPRISVRKGTKKRDGQIRFVVSQKHLVSARTSRFSVTIAHWAETETRPNSSDLSLRSAHASWERFPLPDRFVDHVRPFLVKRG